MFQLGNSYLKFTEYIVCDINKINSIHTMDMLKYIVSVSDVLGGQLQVCN